MGDLFWPGDERAGDHVTSGALLAAMLRVEEAWLDVLVDAGVAPSAARTPLRVDLGRTDELAAAAEATGNPVPALLALLRADLDLPPETAQWLHRGLTSQDVLDTALVLLLHAALRDLRLALEHQVLELVELAEAHRDTAMVARTLTQHAVPTTFGAKVAAWLTGVLDAYDDVVALAMPVQMGGAAGTMAAAVTLGLDPAAARAGLGRRLGLDDAPAWHTTRSTVTRAGDALVRCTDAWGHLAGDVLTSSRPEIGELSEAAGGGSSTMPHKANPVLAVLLRRAALAAPQLGASLHLAAAGQVDERADGAWHVEWATLRDLVRRTLTAAGQAGDLVGGLVVHTDRMAATLAAAADDVLTEQATMAGLVGAEPGRRPADYLGEAHAVVDGVVARARSTLAHPARTQESR